MCGPSGTGPSLLASTSRERVDVRTPISEPRHARPAPWLDADNDGDLDVSDDRAAPATELYNNNRDGTFKALGGQTLASTGTGAMAAQVLASSISTTTGTWTSLILNQSELPHDGLAERSHVANTNPFPGLDGFP